VGTRSLEESVLGGQRGRKKKEIAISTEDKNDWVKKKTRELQRLGEPVKGRERGCREKKEL